MPKLDTFVKIVKALNLSADALLLDGMDQVNDSIVAETGVLDAEETIKRLKTEELQDQWTFHTEKVLSYVKYIDSKEIRQGEEK